MAMPTNGDENARYSKKCEHLLACFWSCVLPALNARINAFRKFITFFIIQLVDIQPSDIFIIRIEACIR